MNGRETLIQELLEKLDNIIDIVEEQEIVESEFGLVREVAENLREEIVALQE